MRSHGRWDYVKALGFLSRLQKGSSKAQARTMQGKTRTLNERYLNVRWTARVGRLALLAACCLFLFWRMFRMFFQDTIKGNEVGSKLLSLTRNEFLPKSINTTVLWNGMSHIPNWSLTHPRNMATSNDNPSAEHVPLLATNAETMKSVRFKHCF